MSIQHLCQLETECGTRILRVIHGRDARATEKRMDWRCLVA